MIFTLLMKEAYIKTSPLSRKTSLRQKASSYFLLLFVGAGSMSRLSSPVYFPPLQDPDTWLFGGSHGDRQPLLCCSLQLADLLPQQLGY